MKKISRKLICIYFQIGVNVIGLPEIYSHEVLFGSTPEAKSKFHS